MSIIIKAGPTDTSESVIRKFQKKIVAEGVIQEYREKGFHKTPSEKRQERRAERLKKIMRAKRYQQY